MAKLYRNDKQNNIIMKKFIIPLLASVGAITLIIAIAELIQTIEINSIHFGVLLGWTACIVWDYTYQYLKRIE